MFYALKLNQQTYKKNKKKIKSFVLNFYLHKKIRLYQKDSPDYRLAIPE